MLAKGPDGKEVDTGSRREHAESLWLRTGVRPKEIELDCPFLVQYLWDAYHKVARSRQAGLGVTMLPEEAWQSAQRNRGVTWQPWEIRAMQELDFSYVGHAVSRDAKVKQDPASNEEES